MDTPPSNSPGRRFIELRKHRRVAPPPGSLLSFAAIMPPQVALENPEGDGTLVNLSPGGCKVTSDIAVLVGHPYRLILQTPFATAPITVDSAVVRWAKPQEFGLKIVSIRPDQEERLLELFHYLRSLAT